MNRAALALLVLAALAPAQNLARIPSHLPGGLLLIQPPGGIWIADTSRGDDHYVLTFLDPPAGTLGLEVEARACLAWWASPPPCRPSARFADLNGPYPVFELRDGLSPMVGTHRFGYGRVGTGGTGPALDLLFGILPGPCRARPEFVAFALEVVRW